MQVAYPSCVTNVWHRWKFNIQNQRFHTINIRTANSTGTKNYNIHPHEWIFLSFQAQNITTIYVQWNFISIVFITGHKWKSDTCDVIIDLHPYINLSLINIYIVWHAAHRHNCQTNSTLCDEKDISSHFYGMYVYFYIFLTIIYVPHFISVYLILS
jgi:hypothetical protein